jgi:hypothetical protein
MVLGLLVLVTLIGGAALNMFSVESKSSIGAGSGFRLQQLSRMGLESSFSLLRSMGAVTSLTGSTVNVASSTATQTFNLTNCNYFPRTDDVKLPNNAIDSTLLSSGNVDCLTARPGHPGLSPVQQKRYNASTPSGSDIYADTNLTPPISPDSDYRSIFPWVRYRSQTIMDGQYGASENIHTQINYCGLASQLTSSSAASVVPFQRYRYQQSLDGLGVNWLDLGDSSMNLYRDGLTLEAWVWMDSANSDRLWQRIFDIGRSQNDGNIVLAYVSKLKKINFEILAKKDCTDPASSTPSPNCSASRYVIRTNKPEVLSYNNPNQLETENARPPSPYTTAESNPSIAVPSNSGSVQDLWYYVAVRLDPGARPRVRIYTQCSRTDNPNLEPPQEMANICKLGTVVPDRPGNTDDWKGLRLRKDYTPASPLEENVNYAHYRKTYVGKSWWGDEDFKGKMRDLRVWDRVLSESELGQEITVNYTPNTTQSSIIAEKIRRESLRISPLYKFGDDRLMYFTVKETDPIFSNTWRLVSCAWNNKTTQRKTQSLRFRVLGANRPEVIEYLPY